MCTYMYMYIHVHTCICIVLRIQIAKLKFRQYQLRADSPNLMLTKATLYGIIASACMLLPINTPLVAMTSAQFKTI